MFSMTNNDTSSDSGCTGPESSSNRNKHQLAGRTNFSRSRGIVSFVRRSSRLDKRLQHAWDEYADTFLLDFGQADHELGVPNDLTFDQNFVQSIWGNANPLIIEIGSGQGENITAAALSHPDNNYLALEVYTPGVAHTMLLGGHNGLTNLKIAQVNAPELFAICSRSVAQEIWTFFPDPWPKTKHHKRRIIQDPLAADVSNALVDQGLWRIATDIDDYALHVHEIMDNRDDFDNRGTLMVSLPTEHVSKGTAQMAYQLPHAMFRESHRFEGRILTNFEKKGLKAGRTIHDFTFYARHADDAPTSHKSME